MIRYGILSAETARFMSDVNKKEKEKIDNLTIEGKVAHEISKAIRDGRMMASFSSVKDTGKWVKNNKEELRELGYEVYFFMGKSTIGDIQIRWSK